MRNTVSIIIAALAVILSLSWTGCDAQLRQYSYSESTNNVPASGLSTDFDWNIGKAVYRTEQTNIILSTISVKLAVAMLYLGAVGPTAKEIENVLSIQPENKDLALSKFNAVLQSLQTSKNEYELNLGTKLFLDKSATANPEFVRALKHYFNSAIETVNFKQKSASIKTINDWAAQVTRGKLQQLVSTDDTQDNTFMLLVNAIYFKGQWEKPFPESATKPNSFNLLSGDKVQTQYMSVIDKFNYAELPELDCKVIRLPYVGKKFAMYVYLPNKRNGLDRLAEQMTPASLKNVATKMKEVNVQVTLPKFHFESTLVLGPLLEQLGLKRTFSGNANLDNLGSSPLGKITVSNVLQKAGLEVNEKGSTAYAATDVVLDTRFPGAVNAYFNADHPFMFTIINEDTNTLAFLGKLINPLIASQRVVAVLPTHIRKTRDVQFAEEVLENEQQSTPDIAGYHEERYNIFDTKLLMALDGAANNSLVVSPESIKSALAMLWEGSKGSTAEELGYVMKLSSDHEINNKILQKHQRALTNRNSNVTLLYGSRLYLALDQKLLPIYEDKLKKDYVSDVKLVNFAQQSTADDINKWVEESTGRILTDIVKSNQFDSFTKIFLVNYLYFKGEWLEQFDPSSTTVDCFYPQPNSCQQSLLMNIITKFNYNYMKNIETHIVELPFKDSRFSMIILLPEETTGLGGLLPHLNDRTLSTIMNEMTPNTVHLTLPRFTIEYSNSLKETLMKMGLEKSFSNADLSGMLDTKDPVYVKDVVHKAKIEIDEKGAKAAASTGVEIAMRSFTESIELRVNRPFVFFILDKSTGGLLFEGTVTSTVGFKQVLPQLQESTMSPGSSGNTSTTSPSSAVNHWLSSLSLTSLFLSVILAVTIFPRHVI